MGEATARTPESRTDTPPPIGERTDRLAESRCAWIDRLRTPRRPRLWFEILLIAVSYWIYSMIRNAVPEQRPDALHNAAWIWKAEETLGISVEKTVNHAVNSVDWLIVGMNYYYATLHFVVTIGVLVWLYRRHPGRYAPIRLVLFATTGVALLGYYFYPLAPPRLMPGESFIDTVLVHGTWGSMASGNLASVSNQYAAMPSMHIGWSVWCGATIVVLARSVWTRAFGVVYPMFTLVVIVATANHFWLDAVGGLLCLSFGFAVSYAWYRRIPYRLPRHVAALPESVPARQPAPEPHSAALTGPAGDGGGSPAAGTDEKWPSLDATGEDHPEPITADGERPKPALAAGENRPEPVSADGSCSKPVRG